MQVCEKARSVAREQGEARGGLSPSISLLSLMIAHGVVLRRELAAHRAAVRVPVALGADGRGIDGAMRHGRVRRIRRKAKGRDLPVRGEAPLHDWIEHLHSVVLTVRTLQTVADAGTIRAHVVFKGGCLGVPGGPD